MAYTAIECPVSCRGAPDTCVWEASLSSATAAFSQKAFLQRFETGENIEEKLAKLEFAEGSRAFDEQVVLSTLDQTLILLNPFASLDLRRDVVKELDLEAIEDQGLLCQRRNFSGLRQPTSTSILEVHDDKPPSGVDASNHGTEGASPSTPSVGCCAVPAHPAVSALLLQVQPGERVLDLCGSAVKAAVLACSLFSDRQCVNWLQSVGQESGALDERTQGSVLVCNVPDRKYARSLEPWLQGLLPPQVPVLQRPAGDAVHVLVSSVEAWQKQSILPLQRLGPFDRIIVDPSCTGCFGARMPDLKYPELAQALLCNAAKLLRPGGMLLYSTARVEERTTDTVVRGFLRNTQEDFEVLPPDRQFGISSVQTECGQLLTLGRKAKQSKLYFSKLKKAL